MADANVDLIPAQIKDARRVMKACLQKGPLAKLYGCLFLTLVRTTYRYIYVLICFAVSVLHGIPQHFLPNTIDNEVDKMKGFVKNFRCDTFA